MMPESMVQPFEFTVSVPLQKYINSVDPNKNFGRSTLPDHEIATSFLDFINKRDVELDYTIQLINKE